jgi:hypothetical protein
MGVRTKFDSKYAQQNGRNLTFAPQSQSLIGNETFADHPGDQNFGSSPRTTFLSSSNQNLKHYVAAPGSVAIRKKKMKDIVYGGELEEEQLKGEIQALKKHLNDMREENTKVKTKNFVLEQELRKRDRDIEILVKKA